MTWNLMPNFWQLLVLAAIPLAIILLYFLKLKRQPLEVPSTYLWHKSIEDLRVNSIWQRLRQSLLLFLQLLLILLAILALARPGCEGRRLIGNRFVFLIDNSASMSAVDIQPTRLQEAKKRVRELIDQMETGDVAMLISFSDTAQVEQAFTDNRSELKRRLDAIRQTNRPTSLAKALPLAAGLANPGRASFEISDTRVAESQPATLYIMSDGRFADVEGFSLGNLTPIYVPIGDPSAPNVGITSFSTQRVEGTESDLQAFARLENYGPEEVTADIALYVDDSEVENDVQEVKIKSGGFAGVVFPLRELTEGTLRVQTKAGGVLAVDDQAWSAVNPPRPAKVLLVSPGNDALETALESATPVADVKISGPDILQSKEYQTDAAAGAYDLVIYDQCAPKEMPRANTLFIGELPPLPNWSAEEKVAAPQIIDIESAHPLMQLLNLGNVRFVEGTPLKPPTGSTVLIDANSGPLFAIAPREGFEDAVLGVEIVGTNEKGERYANTDWPLRLSFPEFVLNTLKYLGGQHESSNTGNVAPGNLVTLRSRTPKDQLVVQPPKGNPVSLRRNKLNSYNFNGTDDLGIYQVREGDQVTERFAVNLFDSSESDVRPRERLNLGAVEVAGQSVWEGARREAWKVLLLLALAVLLAEWYIYNRRVYL